MDENIIQDSLRVLYSMKGPDRRTLGAPGRSPKKRYCEAANAHLDFKGTLHELSSTSLVRCCNRILLLLLASAVPSFFETRLAYAQDFTLGTTSTWAIAAVLVVVSLLVIALRFKWIDFSFQAERPTVLGTSERIGEAPEEVLGEYKSELQSATQLLRQEKEVLIAERDRLREARTDTTSDVRTHLDLVGEIERSRSQLQESAVEIAKLRERLAARTEEIERLQAQLAMEREELQQVREKLQAERHELDELRTQLEKEKVEVDKALQEVAKEWELLGVRREGLDRARREVFDAVQAFRSSREGLLAELKASAQVWSGKAT
jgi:hypothetical protein